jgi:hypothetical protein
MECCDSGLVDSSGTCCDVGAVLDGSAACCSAGILDACGVCGGNATSVDVFSACCATLQDANGVCCEVRRKSTPRGLLFALQQHLRCRLLTGTVCPTDAV